jgi:hypothetical protein
MLEEIFVMPCWIKFTRPIINVKRLFSSRNLTMNARRLIR